MFVVIVGLSSNVRESLSALWSGSVVAEIWAKPDGLREEWESFCCEETEWNLMEDGDKLQQKNESTNELRAEQSRSGPGFLFL